MTDTKPMKHYSNIQEANLSKLLGWRKIGGSGAAPCAPGDIKASEWLGECKTHTKLHDIYFSIDVWKKIKNEAFGHNKKPVLFVDNGSQKEDHTWCICRQQNLNPDYLNILDFPFKVVKHITFKDDDLRVLVKLEYPSKLPVAYRCVWDNESILVMQFNTFKDVYKK